MKYFFVSILSSFLLTNIASANNERLCIEAVRHGYGIEALQSMGCIPKTEKTFQCRVSYTIINDLTNIGGSRNEHPDVTKREIIAANKSEAVSIFYNDDVQSLIDETERRNSQHQHTINPITIEIQIHTYDCYQSQ